MRVLPRALQPALTWLTGKPLSGQRPWHCTPMLHLIASVLPIVAGVALGWVLIDSGWAAILLPVSWLLTTHGIRKLRVMIVHQCSHGNFLRNKRIDTALGTAIAVLLLTQEYTGYRKEHIGDHHSSNHMTLRDPTVQYLVLVLGMRAGMTRNELYRRMWLGVLSPSHQLKATCSRIGSHFRGTAPWYRTAVLALLAGQVGAVTALGIWPQFLLLWVFPLTVLFNAAATIRLSSRHIFPPPGQPSKGRAELAGHTHGVFFGDPAPAPAGCDGRRVRDWLRWWERMLFVHLPGRLFVFVGDGPCHDFHHRFPRSRDWANYIFARQQDIERGHPGWPHYTEVWGLRAAIDAAFTSLGQADQNRYDIARITDVDDRKLLSAFEE
ncbi:fatty acid desaturase [Amycolatopsis sp. NPDC051071]|uniref:fatty acid desaturase n=1 Tax=Amycolatopsis sp. NPDC051071 TaxID=3154637 RepID=UPI00343DE3E8